MDLRENGKTDVRKYRNSKYVIACSILVSLNSVLLGYDVGVMSGVILFIQEDLHITEVQQEFFIGILSIVSIIGSLAGGQTSDAVGRKWTMAIAAGVFQAGVAIMALAPSFTVLILGRILAGIGIGFGVMITPIYIAELSPPAARGSLTSLPEISINLGILLGYISNYMFSGLAVSIAWRIMLGLGILPSIFVACAYFFIPESPRWLVMQNRGAEARVVMLNTGINVNGVERRLNEIKESIAYGNVVKPTWHEFLHPTPTVRRMMITGCGIQIIHQITGIDAMVYYSPTIFKNAGIKGNADVMFATMIVGLTKTTFILVAILLIDRVGRKPLLYVSTIGMASCLIILSLIFFTMRDTRTGSVLAILCVCGNVAFFSMGVGPICWVVSSEIFPLRLRAQAAAIGSVGNRVAGGLVTMSFLSAVRVMTVGGTFLVFGLVSVASVGFVHKFVPETKGKSLELIEMIFQDTKDKSIGSKARRV